MLTYMSIVDDIGLHLRAKRLFEVVPESRKDTHIRKLYVTPEIQKQLFGPYQFVEHKVRMQDLLAFLQGFTSGQRLNVSLCGRKHKNAMLGRMEAPRDEVWEIRHQPSPGLRITGRFASADHFIATDWYLRSVRVPWSDKLPIRDSEAAYKKMKTACQREWQSLFPNHGPIHGGKVNVYLSLASHI